MHSDDSDNDIKVIKAVAKKKCKESIKEAIMLNCNINFIVNVSF